jgi:hypothetical protein
MGKILVPVGLEAVGVPLERPIEALDLMLATLRANPFSDPSWVFEWKLK